MTEINNSMANNKLRPTATQSPSNSGDDRKMTNAQANSLKGLASGLDTQGIIDKIMMVENRRAGPLKTRKAETQLELESYSMIENSLVGLRDKATTLAEQSLWEGKLVESSDDTVVFATGTAGAKPGKHTLVVDQLALNHQISSQGFPQSDALVGIGDFQITVGEDSSVTVVLDESNNTLEGLKDAINRTTKEVQATIIKTGDREAPYQLVLTSQKTGVVGQISLNVDLKGGVAPDFRKKIEDPSEWAGVDEIEEKLTADMISGVGASTSVIRVAGKYEGDEDREFTFTAVQTGIVGGEGALQIRWEDNTGRSGALNLDSFNYAPGQPIPFADGLSLQFSSGEILVGDKFTVKTRAGRSPVFWWLDDSERSPAYSQPSTWDRQGEYGAPVIDGPYTGKEDKKFTMTVEGSGQIGSATNLKVNWKSDEGDSGSFSVGRGYTPGTKLALTDNLTLTLQPGILDNGQVSTFEVSPEQSTTQWWLNDSDRTIPAKIEGVTPFEGGEEPSVEGDPLTFGVTPDFPEELGPRISTAMPLVTGEYTQDKEAVYRFTATKDGTVGTTKGLKMTWDDGKGNSGTIRMGDEYLPGSPMPFDAGLSLQLGEGKVFEGDSFTVRIKTSTIQPAQDALIRFGATSLGGGLEITNSTNTLEDVVEGVKLDLVSVSENPITVTVKGDTESAINIVREFATSYNDLIALVNELTKFDKDNNIAGPLLGDKDVADIRNKVTQLTVDPVPGINKNLNMLFSLGLKMDENNLLHTDETILSEKIGDDFANVADLFRNFGTTDNTGVQFISLSDDTVPSAQGYDVEVKSVATQGHYRTPLLKEPIVITDQNKEFFITVDGKKSEKIELNTGEFTIDEYSRLLQNRISNDPTVGDRGVRVLRDGDRLKFISGKFGSTSNIGFSTGDPLILPAVGLREGDTVGGRDVVATVDGETVQGIGQILRGSDTSEKLKGLRLLVTLSEHQLMEEEPEAKVKITRGVAGRMALMLKDVLDPINGNMQRITKNLQDQIGNYDDQLSNMKERIEAKREALETKFTRLETQMSKLKSQQTFMNSQLAAMPKNSGGGK